MLYLSNMTHYSILGVNYNKENYISHPVLLLLTQAYLTIISVAQLSRGRGLKAILKLQIDVSAPGLYYAFAVSAPIIT